jgi:hypothetical protein
MLIVFFVGGVVMMVGITYTSDKISAIGAGIMVAAVAFINIMFKYLG